MALRGHRDPGKIYTTSNFQIFNEGNFRGILQYREKDDSDLESYLESPGKIKYVSAISQNVIIEACNKEIAW